MRIHLRFILHINTNITTTVNIIFLQIVSPDWLRNRSRLTSNTLMYDTIGEALAMELLLKGGDWGVTVCFLKISFSFQKL